MSTEPPPRTLDARKAAARGATVDGVLRPRDLQRLREVVSGDVGEIHACFGFFRDDENRSLVRVAISADLAVTCQRCLQPMPLHLESDSTLALVGSDELARQLPDHLDPLVVVGQECNLWEVVEEELMLALPAFSYHDTEDCREILAGFTGRPPAAVATAAKPNPFNVLEQLKPGSNKQQE
jgi:uncharacterized protein